jgi:hypothetical protein
MTPNFVAARNAGGRPTLMHRVQVGRNKSHTLCGTSMIGWTRVYFEEPIEILLCLRCKKYMTVTGEVLEFKPRIGDHRGNRSKAQPASTA